jgi:arsenate reductase (glutaredoxin)
VIDKLFLFLFYNGIMTIVYGIKNCVTVQKSLAWLKANRVEYTFWDYKTQGIDEIHLQKWCKKFGWEKVLNCSGMMWRKAAENDKKKVVDETSAIEFMIRVPTSIKRPIVENANGNLLGFNAEEWEGKLS